MRSARPTLIIFAGGLALAARAFAANTAAPAAPTAPAAATRTVPSRPAPAPASATPLPPKPFYRELHFAVDVDAEQSWKKNDPEHPGEQWSKGTTKQHYDVRVRLRSNGQLEVRNLLDSDQAARLEAKTIWLARKAKKEIEASGQKLIIPQTDAERAALNQRFGQENQKCNGDASCLNHINMLYGAIFAAMQYPEALEEETVPGQFYYLEPYRNCLSSSRVTLTMDIAGVHWNKTSKKFVPFSEHRDADSINRIDGLPLCELYLMTLDTEDPVRPLWVENSLIPSPFGTTSYTESGHTQITEEPQPVPGAVGEWVTEVLRHTGRKGTSTVTLPLTLPLNANSTVLGLFTGTAKIRFEWSLTDPEEKTAP